MKKLDAPVQPVLKVSLVHRLNKLWNCDQILMTSA